MVTLFGPKVVTNEAQMATIKLQMVSDIIQKKMCIYQKPDRKYCFVDLGQAEHIFEEDLPMISKQLTILNNTNKQKRINSFFQKLNGVTTSKNFTQNPRYSVQDGPEKNTVDQKE